MKRLLVILSFIFCLSLPAYAGHTQMGGYCSSPCCPGCYPDQGEECAMCGQSVSNEAVSDEQPIDSPVDTANDFSPEVMLGLLALLMMLRYKA